MQAAYIFHCTAQNTRASYETLPTRPQWYTLNMSSRQTKYSDDGHWNGPVCCECNKIAALLWRWHVDAWKHVWLQQLCKGHRHRNTPSRVICWAWMEGHSLLFLYLGDCNLQYYDTPLLTFLHGISIVWNLRFSVIAPLYHSLPFHFTAGWQFWIMNRKRFIELALPVSCCTYSIRSVLANYISTSHAARKFLLTASTQ